MRSPLHCKESLSVQKNAIYIQSIIIIINIIIINIIIIIIIITMGTCVPVLGVCLRPPCSAAALRARGQLGLSPPRVRVQLGNTFQPCSSKM